MSLQENHDDLKRDIAELKEQIAMLLDTVKPIADSYNAATKLGSWAKYLLYIVATIIGIALTVKELLKH